MATEGVSQTHSMAAFSGTLPGTADTDPNTTLQQNKFANDQQQIYLKDEQVEMQNILNRDSNLEKRQQQLVALHGMDIAQETEEGLAE